MILVYDVNTFPDMGTGVTFQEIMELYKTEKILLYSSTNEGSAWGGEKPFFIKEEGDIAEIVTVDLKDMSAKDFIKEIQKKNESK